MKYTAHKNITNTDPQIQCKYKNRVRNTLLNIKFNKNTLPTKKANTDPQIRQIPYTINIEPKYSTNTEKY